MWPFEEDHAAVFYGREQLTAELVGKLAERLSGLGIVVVTGASGAGKSSLLRAGLLPILARGSLVAGSASWPRLLITPTREPLDELAAHLAVLGGMDGAIVRRGLAERPEEAHLTVRHAVLADAARRGLSGLVPNGGLGRLVLLVDQFEEIFTLSRDEDEAAEAQRAAFITALRAAAGTPCGPGDEPPALVVLGVRGDFWDRCAAYPQLADVLQDGQFVVDPMTEPELRRAVTGPAAAAGLEIEPGLTDNILIELRSTRTTSGYEAGALPLLSQAMMVTWENREANRLTNRGYGQTGGVGHAVQASAEAAYNTLTSNQQAVAREVFQRMTIVARDGQLARRRMTRVDLHAGHPAEQSADVDAVLDVFAAKRLVILNDGIAEIAHDALLRAWPRLHSWLKDDQAERVLYSQLMDDATEWHEHRRDASFLYRDARLAAVRQATGRWDADPARYPALTATPRDFLEASDRAATRSARQRRLALAELVLLLIATLAGAGAAINSATKGSF